VPYALASAADLTETARQVDALGRRCLAVPADVRRLPEMQALAERAIAEFGHIDILLANAGIASNSPIATMTPQQWQT
jgi:NAD(P)-dependent dehydrogenase (short-subunit alcohol dehydrogenase family)